MPTYYGFVDDQNGETIGVGPGSEVLWGAAWAGSCVHHHLFDGDTTVSCDNQSFRMVVSCQGVACSTSPDATNGVQSKDGWAGVGVLPTDAGTLVTTATIQHADTVVTQTESVDVVAPAALTLECKYEPTGQWPWIDCPEGSTPNVPGALYLFYAVGKTGDQLIDVPVDFALDGFVTDPDFAKTPLPNLAHLHAPGTGTFTVHASAGALEAEYTITQS